MFKPIVRVTHAVWRHPAWQLLFLMAVLGAVLAWAYFAIASVPGANEAFADTAEERLAVLGASAAAIIAIWGVSGQWAISSRQMTIQFLRQIETDADYIKSLALFNDAARSGDILTYAYPFKKPKGWKALSAKSRRKHRAKFRQVDRAITLVLNTDELVAIGVKNAILDYRLVCSYRRRTTTRRWAVSKSYIDANRTALGISTTWIEFQRLAERMENDPYHNIL